MDRLNTRCQQLFGETVEENFRAPAKVTSKELLGLEYLFSQSTGESGPFTLDDLQNDGPGPEEEVLLPGQSDPDEDEAYVSDAEARDDVVAANHPHIMLTNDETSEVHPPAFEDTCSLNPLPGFQKVERFCSLLVDISLSTEGSLSITSRQRNGLIAAWNDLDEHDKQPQKFTQLYRTHWGNTLYCRTKRDDLVEAAVVQRVKMAQRYAPAQQNISAEHNRVMYTLVKLLWLRVPGGAQTSLDKERITKLYERIQHLVLVDDPVLCRTGIPLPKINNKTVRDFIRRQERLINLHSTKTPSCISKTTSISSQDLPPAPQQPSVLPPADYTQL